MQDQFLKFAELTGLSLEDSEKLVVEKGFERAVEEYFSSNSNIRTINSTDKDNTLYAGGEKSGIALKPKPSPNDIIEKLIEKAAEREEEKSPSKQYSGIGRTLSSNTPQSSSSHHDIDEEEAVIRVLHLWSEGFSVDDGPLLLYNDPKNQAFLEAMKHGHAPIQYLNVKPNQRVNVHIEKKMNEDYKVPEKKIISFSGSGQRLGSIVSTPPAVIQPTLKPFKPNVDPNLPTTTIQIRLHNGERVSSLFNTLHTIGDLWQFVASESNESSFVLETLMPKRALNLDSQTILDADLLNSSVIQRLIK